MVAEVQLRELIGSAGRTVGTGTRSEEHISVQRTLANEYAHRREKSWNLGDQVKPVSLLEAGSLQGQRFGEKLSARHLAEMTVF